MELKHKFLTPLLITLFIFCLIVVVAFTFGRWISNKEYVYELVQKIDIVEIIKDDKELKAMLNEKKVPIEIFDYIDKEDKNELLKKIIDGLYSNKSSIIETSDINSLIKNSIIKYEEEYTLDIYNNIEEEISNFSLKIVNILNNENFVKSFRLINEVINGILYFIIITLALAILLGIILLEKKLAIFILGIIFFISSFAIHYISKNTILNLFKTSFASKYINEEVILEIIELINPIYIIFFAIGVVLLIIYGIIFLKNIMRKIRLMSYDNYYRR